MGVVSRPRPEAHRPGYSKTGVHHRAGAKTFAGRLSNRSPDLIRESQAFAGRKKTGPERAVPSAAKTTSLKVSPIRRYAWRFVSTERHLRDEPGPEQSGVGRDLTVVLGETCGLEICHPLHHRAGRGQVNAASV